MKQSFSTKELAEMWDVSESTVKRWADAGALRCRKTVGGHRKFEMDRLAMVGCAEGELHQLAAILVRALLESEAWKVIYFTSPTPLFSFAEAVDRFKPQLVCISITMADNIERARRDYEDLRRAAERQHTQVVLGGAALTDAAVRARFPESHYAGSLHDLLDLIKK